MTGAIRRDLTDDRTSNQREVAEQVQDLVPDKLIFESKRTIDDPLVIEDDAVLDRSAARQSRRAELLDVAEKSERARRGDLAQEIVVLEIEVHRLFADDGMIEIDLVLEDETIRRSDPNALL